MSAGVQAALLAAAASLQLVLHLLILACFLVLLHGLSDLVCLVGHGRVVSQHERFILRHPLHVDDAALRIVLVRAHAIEPLS